MSRFTIHPWKVVETAFAPEDLRFSESLMSLGNGAFGLRGNLEEDYAGDTHRGTYIGGVWFPDKTRVGWWKNGYPRYFGKVINAMNLIGLRVFINGEALDLDQTKASSFYRELDMKEGILRRRMTVGFPQGEVVVEVERFVSMKDKSLLALRYQVTPSFDCRIRMEPYLDGLVHNEDSNYEETFWEQLDCGHQPEDNTAFLLSRTRENPFDTPRFAVAAAFYAKTNLKGQGGESRPGYAGLFYESQVAAGEGVQLDKLVNLVTDRDHPMDQLVAESLSKAASSAQKGYDAAREAHVAAWDHKWQTADVVIEGDQAAQQGIRFNLFHLLSTYTGEDARLNIGPKGFTGEKYGGATYWDTEAYCFPVYLATAGEEVARQLLRYRFLQLEGAYHNAQQQGLPGALYPMVTFNGIECHNEWEITFMEIHRNGAIAHAIFHYTQTTGDESYLFNEGLTVLLGIARFWAGRVHYNERTKRYMIHGVTGPNEYENNVNNNWYTNRIAAWCLQYFLETCDRVSPQRRDSLGLSEAEYGQMADIARKMYEPYDPERGIFVQHDTFLDKALLPASALSQADRPLNQHWSWDRILRSCFIKQADVLQGMYFLGHLYDVETKKRNFDFYEPLTVHESSLSPCVHAILAAEIGQVDKAIQMYHRTARLDLDNINNDTDDGLHITSMSGAWLAIAQGFAGMRTVKGLSFAPVLPKGWQGYSFRFLYRGRVVSLSVHTGGVRMQLISGEALPLSLYGEPEVLVKLLDIERTLS